MPEILSSQAAYRELVEESDDDWLLGLVAFAVFEEQRMEWMRHIEEVTGKPPSDADISNWYRQQPAGALLRAKGVAESSLVAYAGAAVDEALQSEQREIFASAVISEVRLCRRFLPQFAINVAGGLVSAVVFAALLIVLYLSIAMDVSPQGLLQGHFDGVVQEKKDGQAIGKPGGD